jgi:hypothetical protein
MANIVELVRPQAAFDPETVAVLVTAFNEAWERLRRSGSECARPAYARAMQEVVARRIFEMAQQGIRDYGPSRSRKTLRPHAEVFGCRGG